MPNTRTKLRDSSRHKFIVGRVYIDRNLPQEYLDSIVRVTSASEESVTFEHLHSGEQYTLSATQGNDLYKTRAIFKIGKEQISALKNLVALLK